jgi:hypothetical protein
MTMTSALACWPSGSAWPSFQAVLLGGVADQFGQLDRFVPVYLFVQ